MDEIEHLCKQLDGFHVSARIQRGADAKELSAIPPNKINRRLLKELPFAFDPGLPSPKPCHRPCWEPPANIDYSWFEAVLQVDKEITIRDGNKDIAFRTDLMDYFLENHLQWCYRDLVEKRERAIGPYSDRQEDLFWQNLL